LACSSQCSIDRGRWRLIKHSIELLACDATVANSNHKIFYSFLMRTCAPPPWKRLLHCLRHCNVTTWQVATSQARSKRTHQTQFFSPQVIFSCLRHEFDWSIGDRVFILHQLDLLVRLRPDLWSLYESFLSHCVELIETEALVFSDVHQQPNFTRRKSPSLACWPKYQCWLLWYCKPLVLSYGRIFAFKCRRDALKCLLIWMWFLVCTSTVWTVAAFLCFTNDCFPFFHHPQVQWQKLLAMAISVPYPPVSCSWCAATSGGWRAIAADRQSKVWSPLRSEVEGSNPRFQLLRYFRYGVFCQPCAWDMSAAWGCPLYLWVKLSIRPCAVVFGTQCDPVCLRDMTRHNVTSCNVKIQQGSE